MNFEHYLTEQFLLHPSIQPQDIIKLCFQAAYGAEHLLYDLQAARAYFFREFEATEPRDIPLYERISDQVCRVNLAAWRYRELPAEKLFDLFASSATVPRSGDSTFFEYIETVESLLNRNSCNVSIEDWQTYLTEYQKSGIRAVHHSTRYRESEKPAYRIVDYQYIRQLP